MIGIEVDGKPLMRAYSIASASYEDELEFFSIKVENGALTSRLKDMRLGQNIMVSTKAAGTLVPGYLIPGKNLYLLSSGTGLAPFISIVRDPNIYDNFEKIIVVHCVREASELAYQQEIEMHLPNNEYFGDIVREKLLYYPTVTREDYEYNSLRTSNGLALHKGRMTSLLKSNALANRLNLSELSREHDHFMLCGNNAMLEDIMKILNDKGFLKATSRSQGHYVIEQAFIDKS